jgi:hypothetical protein
MPNPKGMFWFAVIVLLVAVLLFIFGRRLLVPSGGLPVTSNNLKYVQCNKKQPNYPGSTEIAVNSTIAIDQLDEVIFVCTGEKLHWKTKASDAGVRSFAIDILDPSSPFQSGHLKLPSNPQGQTDDEVVTVPPAGQHSKAYKYKIVVTKTDNSTIELDPQIIPMGGGG